MTDETGNVDTALPVDTTIPDTMTRLVVTAPGSDVKSCTIATETVPVPLVGSGQVLIRVVAAAVNPSDYGSWYRCRPDQCPFAMGKEGCGIVVACGGGLTSYLNASACKIGSKVGFIGLTQKQGAYSEYVVANAVGNVFPLPANLPTEDAASFFVNPYTALGIFDTCKAESSSAMVHTAAASQLGQMMVKLAPSEGIELINVVRREEQKEVLTKLGAKHVIVTGKDSEGWMEDLKAKITELNCTVAFDAVAGRSTGDLLDCLPRKGTAYVYGGLAGRVENVDPMALIYHEKKLKGFFLTSWVQKGGSLSMVPRMMTATRKVNAGLKDGWSSSQFVDTTMEKMQGDIVKLLESASTGQKLRVRLDQKS